MSPLHAMLAVNLVLVAALVVLCAKYRIPQKAMRRITCWWGGKSTEGVIDPVLTEQYRKRSDIFGSSPRNVETIVMLGDSLTETTPFDELLGFRFRVRNRGISSDNTQGVLNRLDEIAGLRAAKVFVLLGINDIGNGIPLDESMRNYREIVRRIRLASPETQIYVQSVFPVDHEKLADNARCRRRTSGAIREFNTELMKLAQEEGCEFLDTYSVFDTGNGEMDGRCTFDGLHLNGDGMMRWCRFLEQYMTA